MRVALAAAGLGLAVLALTACSPPPLKEYSYPAWGFAASFRSPPTETDTPAAADGSQPHMFQAEMNKDPRDFIASATDESASKQTDDQILKQAPDAIAQNAHAAVGPITNVVAGKVVGHEFQIIHAGQSSARVRVFVANKRLYQLVASSTTANDPEVQVFLDSFRILGQ
jgi:hypothetical protein